MPRELWVDSLENLKEFLKILKKPDLNLSHVATFQKDGEPFDFASIVYIFFYIDLFIYNFIKKGIC